MATAAAAAVLVGVVRAMSADQTMMLHTPPLRSLVHAACAAAALVLGAAAADTDDRAMGECARDLLRTRLATAVAGDDVLAALAIERELLALCSRRQELVAEVLENEARLAALQPGEPVIDETVVIEVFEAPRASPDNSDPLPDYGWFSILGTAGNLRAGITDGNHTWWTTEGATLPGGVAIVAIHSRPPGVRVAGAASHVLPFRPPPDQR